MPAFNRTRWLQGTPAFNGDGIILCLRTSAHSDPKFCQDLRTCTCIILWSLLSAFQFTKSMGPSRPGVLRVGCILNDIVRRPETTSTICCAHIIVWMQPGLEFPVAYFRQWNFPSTNQTPTGWDRFRPSANQTLKDFSLGMRSVNMQNRVLFRTTHSTFRTHSFY